MKALFLALLVVLPLSGCRHSEEKRETVVYRPGQMGEPAAFWAKLANNTNLDTVCRRVCVLELFRRHVRPGMSLGEVAALLENPTWLDESVVTDFALYSGYVPLRICPGERAFGIDALSKPTQQGWIMITVKSERAWTRDQLAAALRGSIGGEISKAPITAIAVLEPHPR